MRLRRLRVSMAASYVSTFAPSYWRGDSIVARGAGLGATAGQSHRHASELASPVYAIRTGIALKRS